jgi:hypothetical protein
MAGDAPDSVPYRQGGLPDFSGADNSCTVGGMRRSGRSLAEVLRELTLSGPERRAARAERHAEAQMRRERDSTREAERMAARTLAESQRYKNFGPWKY